MHIFPPKECNSSLYSASSQTFIFSFMIILILIENRYVVAYHCSFCISLMISMISDVELFFFMYLLAICMSSLRHIGSGPFLFFNWFICFLALELLNSYVHTKPLRLKSIILSMVIFFIFSF